MGSAHRRLHSPEFLKLFIPGNSHVEDVSGNGTNGTWDGTAAYADGPFGHTVLDFDGTNRVSGSDANLPSGASERTVAMMLRAEANNKYAFGYGSFVALQEFSVLFASDNKIYLARNGGSAVVWDTALALNTWYHVLVQYDGTNAIGYVNGKRGSTTAVAGLNTQLTVFGIGERLGTASWSGQIAKVRVYNALLTGDEAKALYRYDMTH